ncbi:MAG: cytoplasmic protein [Spirochaetota bacterium]
MNKKQALFAFNGEAMCFPHALLNCLDLYEKGYDVLLIIEGSSTKLLPSFQDGSNPFTAQFHRCQEHGLLAGVCAACSALMGTQQVAKEMKLTLLGDMHGHPSMEEYIEAGYTIITF